jgi:Ca2+-binding EF-hand superfamily protein
MPVADMGARMQLEGNRVMTTKTSRRFAVIAGLSGSLALMLGAANAFADVGAENTMKLIDTNGDGVINLTEAKFAAAAVIVKIDKDHNGVLNNDELAGRVVVVDKFSPAGGFMFWKTQGTLTKQEYLDMVEGRFKPATPDDDGTLDVKELVTEDGQALLKLLQ